MNTIDVLLLSSPSHNPALYFVSENQSMPPLGLGYIATYLKKYEYTVKIIDMFMHEITFDTVIDTLKNNHVNIIGISCTTETYNIAVHMAELIKALSEDYTIVFGGPHTSFEYREALKNKAIDYVILNEGERSFKKFCDYSVRGIGNKNDLKGIAYKLDGDVFCAEPEPFITNLDELPFPDRTLFDNLEKYKYPATLQTSRGCPGNCIFCAASMLSGGRYRMRSAKSVVAEFEYLKALGFNHVCVTDDTMTVSIPRLDEILNCLIESKLNVTWFCESRVDSINEDILAKMKKAGLTNIQFGVEAGNQKILDSIKKDITIGQVKNVFEWCNKLDINAHSNMIIGQPQDDVDTINDTIKMAEEIVSLTGRISFSVCTPFPGTQIWQAPEKFGIEIIDHNLNHYDTFNPVFNTKNLTANQIRNEYYRAVKQLGQKVNATRIPASSTP